MTIEIKDLDGGLGTTITGRGVITGQEYVEVHTSHLTQDKEKFKKYRYSLSDWTEVTQVDISNHDFETVPSPPSHHPGARCSTRHRRRSLVSVEWRPVLSSESLE